MFNPFKWHVNVNAIVLVHRVHKLPDQIPYLILFLIDINTLVNGINTQISLI
jgi:hypothetical protein